MFSVIELATRHPALRVKRSRRQCDGSDGSLGKVFQSLGEGSSSLRRPWSSQQQQRSRYAAAVKSHAAAGEWPRARMHKAHAPQRRHKTTAQLSIGKLATAAAATSPPPLLLCCCCCAAASAAPRSAMLIRDAYANRESRKKCPASVFRFLHLALWFDPGCWDPKQQLHAAAARRGGRNEPRHRRQYCS